MGLLPDRLQSYFCPTEEETSGHYTRRGDAAHVAVSGVMETAGVRDTVRRQMSRPAGEGFVHGQTAERLAVACCIIVNELSCKTF